jgi:hypothetical protein
MKAESNVKNKAHSEITLKKNMMKQLDYLMNVH